jgi:hypothetical protein
LAIVAQLLRDYRAAGSLAGEGLGPSRALGEKNVAANALMTLGHVARHDGDLRQAALRFRESLALQQEIGHKLMASVALVGPASIAATGDPTGGRQAVRLLGAVRSHPDASGVSMARVTRPAYERLVAALRTALGEDAFAAAWEAGRP